MTMQDQTGLATTAENQQAIQHFDNAIANLSLWRDPIESTDKALEKDPEFFMGHALKAYMDLLSTDRDYRESAREGVERINVMAGSVDRLNMREKLHALALKSWEAGNMRKAGEVLDQLLTNYPEDMLALWMAHQIDFYLGDATQLRDRVARVLPRWDRSHPLYSFLLGMYSFGLEEAGEYARAEEVGKESVELNPEDVWGIHAVAHSLEMQGEFDHGADYMKSYYDYWRKNNFFVPHNALHTALFKLEQNDIKAVVDLYDDFIFDAEDNELDPVILSLVDASSALWRLYLENEDVGERWKTLASRWKGKAFQAFYTFNDMHAMMAFVGSGDIVAADRLINTLESYLENGTERDSINYAITREVGLPICKAIHYFGMKKYDVVVDQLFPIRDRVHEFGGSHAQRDAVARTLLEASIRSNNKALANDLITIRLRDRPKSTYNRIKESQIEALR